MHIKHSELQSYMMHRLFYMSFFLPYFAILATEMRATSKLRTRHNSLSLRIADDPLPQVVIRPVLLKVLKVFGHKRYRF